MLLQDEGSIDPKLMQALLMVAPVADPPPLSEEVGPSYIMYVCTDFIFTFYINSTSPSLLSPYLAVA